MSSRKNCTGPLINLLTLLDSKRMTDFSQFQKLYRQKQYQQLVAFIVDR